MSTNNTIKLSGGVAKTSWLDTAKNALSAVKDISVKSSGVSGNLEYVKMLRNPLLTAKITTPRGQVITSALSGSFGFGLGNNWNPLVDVNQIPLVGELTNFANPLLSMTGSAQMAFQSLWSTTASWSGSRMPEFRLDLTFLRYDKNVDLFTPMLQLAEGTLTKDQGYDIKDLNNDFLEGIAGTVDKGITATADFIGGAIDKFSNSDKSSVDNLTQNASTAAEKFSLGERVSNFITNGASQAVIEAPFGYGVEANTGSDPSNKNLLTPKPHTTYALTIGNWFSANNLLITDMQPRFSKEINPDGTPVYLTINVGFRPYRNIDFTEFTRYFVKANLSTVQRSALGSALLGGTK